MNRTMNDNALLAEAMHERWLTDMRRLGQKLAVCAAVVSCGMAIGGIWFLCVAVPAKALWR